MVEVWTFGDSFFSPYAALAAGGPNMLLFGGPPNKDPVDGVEIPPKNGTFFFSSFFVASSSLFYSLAVPAVNLTLLLTPKRLRPLVDGPEV